MIQLLEESRDDLVALRLSGSVDKNDYDVMLPILEEKIKHFGKIRVYAELMDLEYLSMKALWEDLKFDFKHANDFSRAAIVGNAAILDWLVVMATPFTSAKIKHFEFDKRAEAMAWINQND